jgi:hypothetical protein
MEPHHVAGFRHFPVGVDLPTGVVPGTRVDRRSAVSVRGEAERGAGRDTSRREVDAVHLDRIVAGCRSSRPGPGEPGHLGDGDRGGECPRPGPFHPLFLHESVHASGPANRRSRLTCPRPVHRPLDGHSGSRWTRRRLDAGDGGAAGIVASRTGGRELERVRARVDLSDDKAPSQGAVGLLRHRSAPAVFGRQLGCIGGDPTVRGHRTRATAQDHHRHRQGGGSAETRHQLHRMSASSSRVARFCCRVHRLRPTDW